jgi:hypothetical protein
MTYDCYVHNLGAWHYETSYSDHRRAEQACQADFENDGLKRMVVVVVAEINADTVPYREEVFSHDAPATMRPDNRVY